MVMMGCCLDLGSWLLDIVGCLRKDWQLMTLLQSFDFGEMMAGKRCTCFDVSDRTIEFTAERAVRSGVRCSRTKQP